MKRIITMPASELTTQFNDNLLIKLRNYVEGKCNREGYIEKGSVEIIDHGTLDTEVIRYKGSVRVKVDFTGKVVNPVFGEIIDCKIKRYNDFGLMAYAGPLKIVVPFGENKNNKNVTFIEGQNLKVKVVESTIVLNDTNIYVYATFYDEKIETKNTTKNAIPVEELLNQINNEDVGEDLGELTDDDFEEVEEVEEADEPDSGEDGKEDLGELESDDDSEDENNEDESDDNLERSSKLSHRKGSKAHLITFPYDEENENESENENENESENENENESENENDVEVKE
jgi:DNA-directed RNA polymerase subunit E'/Rpb7